MPRKSTSTPKTTKTKPKSSSRAKKTPAPKKTGGRLSAVRQPPAPIASVRVSHGVSGYQTTGVPGAFNAGYSTPAVPLSNLDPRASRMDIQASGNVINVRAGNNNYNQSTPASIAPVGAMPYASFTSEAVWSQRFAGGAGGMTVTGLARNQGLQAQLRPVRSSHMDGRAVDGYYGNDLFMQSRLPNMDRGRAFGQPAGDIMSPVQPTRLDFNARPNPSARQGDQPSGTTNHGAALNVTTPMGQVTLHRINDVHTPQPATAGYAAPGTHPAHGPSPSAPFDGSWTLDIVPGSQAPPGLADLPPAADVPVQTYSGSGPRMTSIYSSRPMGGSISRPQMQRAVRVGA